MPVQNVVDEFGEGFLIRITPRGQHLAIMFNEDTVDNFPNMQLRDDDIMQCSFAKAGCHWSWEILRLLVWGRDSHADKQDKEHHMIEFSTMEALEKLPAPRILNHHISFDACPNDLFQKNVKVVYVYRNIKDIAVSYYHHVMKMKAILKYDASFSHFLKRFAAGMVDCGDGGGVFDYIKKWDEGIKKLGSQVLVVSYEDMKKDIIREIRRMAEFLGVEADDQTLSEIAKMTDFNYMRSSKTEKVKSSTNKEDAVKATKSTDFSDPKSVGEFQNKKGDLMGIMIDETGHHMMYRKGQVGDWKNYFTVAESEWFDQLIQERLGDLTYHKFQYE